MKDFILSAFADEYASSFEEQLKALNRFDIRYLELRYLNKKNVSLLSLQEIKEAKAMMDHYGIQASAIGSPLGKIPLDGDWKEHLAMARNVFEGAKLFQTNYVRIFSFYPPKGESIAEKKGEVFSRMEELILLAREYGLTLCHENEAKIYGDTPSRCRQLLDHFNGELQCVFDMGNFVLEGVDPYPEAYELLKPYLAYFHIKDALMQGAIVPAGKGEAKIREILCAHRNDAKKEFFVSLEPHLQTFSGLNALVGRSFENPYQYENKEAAFADAVCKFKELF